MKSLALAIFVVVALTRLALSWLNLRHLSQQGHVVPPGLEREVDAARLRKISDYTTERARFGLLHSALSSLVFGAFLFGGGLGSYDRYLAQASSSFVLGNVKHLDSR